MPTIACIGIFVVVVVVVVVESMMASEVVDMIALGNAAADVALATPKNRRPKEAQWPRARSSYSSFVEYIFLSSYLYTVINKECLTC